MLSKFTYEKLSVFAPRPIVNVIGRLMNQGGFRLITPRAYIGFAFFFSLCLAATAFFIVNFYTRDASISTAMLLGVFFLSTAFFYLLLLVTADARASEVEQVLPHALQIISTNIRAGMTLENAIWGAARPEFGAFQEEIQRVSADAFGGVPIIVALSRLNDRVRSTVLERAVKLLVQGISLGGEMSTLLEQVANDIRTLQRLKDEIATSTTTYAMFIVFTTVIISPLLFSISVFYAELNQDVFQKRVSTNTVDKDLLQQSGFASIPFLHVASSNLEDIKLFAISNVLITSIAAAFILALIRFGSLLKGLFYAPVFALIALAVFFLASSAIRAILLPTFA